MNRLTYPRKFLLISVLFGLPLALVTVLLFAEINQSLDIARRQIVGLRYLTAIQPLFRAVQSQSEASVAGPTGEALEDKRKKDLAQIVEGLAALEKADGELGTRLNTRDRLAPVKRHADILRLELERPGAVVSDELREPLLSALRSLMARVGDTSRLILDEELTKDLGTMRADVTKVRQALFNLLSNASKFTENGTITLAVARERVDHAAWTIGAIGFEGRWDYGAIGTVANLAARLCAEAKAGQILASTRVGDAVDDLIEAEPVEPLTLKGFHRPMPAVDILRLRGSPS